MVLKIFDKLSLNLILDHLITKQWRISQIGVAFACYGFIYNYRTLGNYGIIKYQELLDVILLLPRKS